MTRREYHRAWRKARFAERVEVDGRLVHPGASHGTSVGYAAYGCRCAPCRHVGSLAVEEAVDRRRARERGHGTSGWRRGCRCVLCKSEKARTDRLRRRRAARKVLDGQKRARILDAIRSGRHPMEVAQAHGVTWTRILGLTQYDRRWSARLDAALVQGRNPAITHGRYHSYQKHRCRCPECRAAKARYR